MKSLFLSAALAIGLGGMLASEPAQAAGCLKGAAVGGVAGHFAGRHTLLGAGAGCVIGRHQANKAERDRAAQNERYARPDYDNGDRRFAH
ncbi:MAG TPA: hypothetical protein VGC80_15155 [Acetobacteraceae bacterium]